MKYKWFVILTILVLLLNSGTALAYEKYSSFPLSNTSTVTASSRVVRIAMLEPASIDPSLASDFTITNQLFSGLTRIDPVTNAPISDLAASWSMSLGATQFTFTLRNGLTWSNGSPLTAYDVQYGILRSLNPATGANSVFPLYVIQNAADYNYGNITNPNLVGITVLNSTQIQFTLESPASYFPAILSLPVAFPTPAGTIATWGTSWTEPAHIVTSGPYRLTEWVHNDYMLLDKFASFYDASNVQIDQVSVKLTDELTAWNLFLSGSLDTVNVPASVLGAVQADPTLSPLLHSVN